MKVLQINQYYGYGSTGRIVLDLQNLSVENGIDSYVAYSTSKNDKIKETEYKIGNSFSYKLHALLARIGGKEGYFSYFSTYMFLRYLNKIKPDIIHIHNLHDHYLNVPTFLKYVAKHNIKTIITMHDCWILTGGCFHFAGIGCEMWKKECGNCPKRYLDTPAYLYDASSTIHNDRRALFNSIQNLTIVGVSNWIVSMVKQSVLKEKNALTIHNGVDTRIFKPVVTDLKSKLRLDDKFIILAPANKWMDPINQDNLKYLLSKIQDDIVVIFFGYGCDMSLKKEGVINYGFTGSTKELVELYNISDVFINSTKEDSLPFANLEPQACGTPVITFGNTGTIETVDGQCSFFVNNDDMESLWAKVLEIKTNGKKYYSSRCVKWIRDNYDKKENYKRYIELYRSL